MDRGDVRIGFGIQEGWNQAQAQAQFVANVVDFGLNLQAAIEAPRFSKYSLAPAPNLDHTSIIRTVFDCFLMHSVRSSRWFQRQSHQ
jgi:gamma-glutamyltranspeptidase